MSSPLKQEDLDTVINDIIAIRSEPETMIERFNIVLYSLKGFKKNESTVFFIEGFINELTNLDPLPRMEVDPFLGEVAQKILNASEKMKVNPEKFSESEINNIVKPLIKNYENLNIIYDTHTNASKFLTKIVLKEDSRGSGFDSPNVITLFDTSTNYIGGAGRLIGRTGHYLIVTIDKYDKIQKRTDISEEEYNRYKILFKTFDTDNDGILTPKEFEDIINQTGIKNSWPLILKFQKLLFANDPNRGVNLEEFIDAIIKFGLFDNEDAIRRVFELYCDDTENDTISLLGLKRIANDLDVEPHKGDVNILYKFAVDKNTNVSWVEFRDFIKKGIKKGDIVIPKKL